MEQVHALIEQDCVDPRELRKAEEEALAKRVAEESGPVATRRPTPVECVKLGLTLDKAQVMGPENLTREDAEYLVSRGVKMTHIGELYGFEIKKLYNLLGNRWGLRKNRDMPEYPWSSVTVVKALKEEPVQEERLTAIEWLRKHGTLTDPSGVIRLRPSDFNKDDAEELLKAGATYKQLAAYYGMASGGHLGYYLRRAGLIGLSVNKSPGKKETEKQVGQPPTEGIKQHEDVKTSLEITEAEKLDVFGDPEPLVTDAARRAVEMGALKVETGERLAPEPTPGFDLSEFEEATVRCNLGGSWIRVRATKDSPNSGEIDFSKILFEAFVGQRFRVRVNQAGEIILLQLDPSGLYRINNKQAKAPAGNLVALLRERGVQLPARYMVERQGELWVGRLEI